ncbi:hypothetical protein Back2_06840 [Nocardioides baekrokdamisoli]|uniref:Integral membrane protein n=1 Tax=Nocardioides baekrokdamisoli TaxID=1804624 RepID=A0A3G9IBY7_9ACTN|nr:hypothetical protein [Nocardioides baekrokdamisoli]BBH16397.1 hypothetical protein Back2_06840 [Nocardioides baekrokdamisoli]
MISPLSLRLAAALVALEALLLLVVAVRGVIDPSNVGVAVGLGVVYLVSAVGLALAAVGLWERRSWGRAPVVLAQLVILGMAWDVRDDAVIASIGVVLGLAVLVCVLHPASTRALSGDS